MGKLTQKYAVVTGAGKGIGRAIVERFLEDDVAGVAILEMDIDLANATAKELGGSIKVIGYNLYEKGEGLEKREDDFAAEIAKMVNKA